MKSNFKTMFSSFLQVIIYFWFILGLERLGQEPNEASYYSIYCLISLLFSDLIKPSYHQVENFLCSVSNRYSLVENFTPLLSFVLLTKLNNWYQNGEESALVSFFLGLFISRGLQVSPHMQDEICLFFQRPVVRMVASYSPSWIYKDVIFNSTGDSKKDYKRLRLMPREAVDRPKALEELCKLAFNVIENQYGRIQKKDLPDDDIIQNNRLNDIIGLSFDVSEYLQEAKKNNYSCEKHKPTSMQEWINQEIAKFKNEIYKDNFKTVIVAKHCFKIAQEKEDANDRKSYFMIAKFLFSCIRKKDAEKGFFASLDQTNYFIKLYYLAIINYSLSKLSPEYKDKKSLLNETKNFLNGADNLLNKIQLRYEDKIKSIKQNSEKQKTTSSDFEESNKFEDKNKSIKQKREMINSYFVKVNLRLADINLKLIKYSSDESKKALLEEAQSFFDEAKQMLTNQSTVESAKKPRKDINFSLQKINSKLEKYNKKLNHDENIKNISDNSFQI
jgi:hypothetical protein